MDKKVTFAHIRRQVSYRLYVIDFDSDICELILNNFK